jgi:hypothetical protein
MLPALSNQSSMTRGIIGKVAGEPNHTNLVEGGFWTTSLTRSALISTGIVPARSNRPASRSRRCSAAFRVEPNSSALMATG